MARARAPIVHGRGANRIGLQSRRFWDSYRKEGPALCGDNLLRYGHLIHVRLDDFIVQAIESKLKPV